MESKAMNASEPDEHCDDVTPLERLSIGPSAERVAESIRIGMCPADRAFDRFLPDASRSLSGRHWTPLVVTSCVADWLDELGARSVVDIGSGVGKFCVATGLAGFCHFTGIEHRPHLVRAARDLARLFRVEDRVTFVEGAFGEVPTPEADVYYLFNPFGENLFSDRAQIDAEVSLNQERFTRDVAHVEELLRRASVGTYLLTYNGFGGSVPGSYREIRAQLNLPCPLRLWRKMRAGYEGRPHSSDAV